MRKNKIKFAGSMMVDDFRWIVDSQSYEVSDGAIENVNDYEHYINSEEMSSMELEDNELYDFEDGEYSED